AGAAAGHAGVSRGRIALLDHVVRQAFVLSPSARPQRAGHDGDGEAVLGECGPRSAHGMGLLAIAYARQAGLIVL
ncbi:MAG: hypothetical protein M3008_07180, partial [Chloroflexota bacterium]|nr:hypothetical protein [Chloroflexota bacterium]